VRHKKNRYRPKDWGVNGFWRYRKKSSFLAAPDLTFFIFPKEAVQQVKAKKCIGKLNLEKQTDDNLTTWRYLCFHLKSIMPEK